MQTAVCNAMQWRKKQQQKNRGAGKGSTIL